MLAFLCVAQSLAAEVAMSPRAPEQARASFRLADSNLTIELVAAEPDVLSPVAICWDADGRLYVAEMTDYPSGPAGGQVRVLEDSNGDGRYEKAAVFADGLPFPTSVLAWNGGLLVTAAPNLWYLRDTDGDARADERRVLFSGFAEGNQQLRANGLLWGLDNWIYGANGRSDGEITVVDPAFAAGATATARQQTKISIRRRDFRFRPDTGAFEAVAGFSQFGLARDDWGNRFASWNTIPIRHVVIEERYLARNPYLSATEAVADLLPSGDSGRVFPLTPPPLVFNHESSSHFNALAGLTIYRGDALGDSYRGNAFVGESLRNLVHRRVLHPESVTFSAVRGEEGREFLASTDPWFHPVNFATGPDGALYVVDFYRKFVEHPGWVPPTIRDQPAWREGAGHGRIWRVRNTTVPPRTTVRRLSQASSAALVQSLRSNNGWVRDTAQRLLIERRASDASTLLKQEAQRRTAPTLARLHSLWTLEGLGALDVESVVMALRDRHPQLRVHGLRLLELAGGDFDTMSPRQRERVGRAVAALARDSNPQVRLQLALTLGGLALGNRAELLAELAEDARDRWQVLAILSSAGENAWEVLRVLLRRPSGRVQNPGPVQTSLLRELAGLVGARPEGQNASAFLENVRTLGAAPGTLVLLSGFGDGLQKRQEELRAFVERTEVKAERAAPWLDAAFSGAAEVAASKEAPRHLRIEALRLLAHSGSPAIAGSLLALLSDRSDAEIQTEAARTLGALADASMAEGLFTRWDQYSPAVRRHVAGHATRSEAVAAALVGALERGVVKPRDVDASLRQQLLQTREPNLRLRFAASLAVAGEATREAVVKRFQPALQLSGRKAEGAAIFNKACVSCHAIQGRGGRVGPDLSGISSRPKEALLVDILDPNRQVSPDFISYTVQTRSGESLTGLLAAETAANVTLRRAGEGDLTLARTDIEHLRADARSLMPEGLEEGLSPQDVADLLEFLRNPDKELLPSE